MGVKLARPLFIGTHCNWLLLNGCYFFIKKQVGLHIVSIFRSTIDGFQQHVTIDY